MAWRPVWLATGVLTIVQVWAGCGMISWTRVTINDPIKPEDVGFIVQGKTAFSEVIANLGAPDELKGSERGAVALYRFGDLKYFRVNFGWGLRFLVPVPPDMVLAGGGVGTDVFLILFDSNWIVQGHAFAQQSYAAHFDPWPF